HRGTCTLSLHDALPISIHAAKEAMEDSGLDLDKENRDRIGVIFSAGIGGIRTFEEEVGNYYLEKDRGPRFNPFFIPKMIADIAADRKSTRLNSSHVTIS